jgi:hypothetical protein
LGVVREKMFDRTDRKWRTCGMKKRLGGECDVM